LDYGPKKGVIHLIQEAYNHDMAYRVHQISHPDGNPAHSRVVFNLGVSIDARDLRLDVSSDCRAKLLRYGVDPDFFQVSHLHLDDIPWEIASTMTQYLACRGSMLQIYRKANPVHQAFSLCWELPFDEFQPGSIPRSANTVIRHARIIPSYEEQVEQVLMSLVDITGNTVDRLSRKSLEDRLASELHGSTTASHRHLSEVRRIIKEIFVRREIETKTYRNGITAEGTKVSKPSMSVLGVKWKVS